MANKRKQKEAKKNIKINKAKGIPEAPQPKEKREKTPKRAK